MGVEHSSRLDSQLKNNSHPLYKHPVYLPNVPGLLPNSHW